MYQIGGLITGEVGFNFFTIVAIVIFAAFLYLMFRPNKYVGDNEVKIDVSKITANNRPEVQPQLFRSHRWQAESIS